MSSSSSPSAKKHLTRAAVEGMLAGFAIMSSVTAMTAMTGCSSKQGSGAVVSAPMESTSSSASSTTAARPLPLPMTNDEGFGNDDRGEPSAKDCCRGKNECKGKGGCTSARNECRGLNECKGQGTSCDRSDMPSSTSSSRGSRPMIRAVPQQRIKSSSCCSGKNECKGKSGCRTPTNPGGAGMNDCKAKGTNCNVP